jgi:phosphoglycerate dehydrogenase-like enzyme
MMATISAPRCVVGPASAPEWMSHAVVEGGGVISDPAEAEVVIWFHSPASELAALLEATPKVQWVQLPAAGIEAYSHLIDDRYTWTAAKGVYAEPVAEHALMLALAGMRNLGSYARVSDWTKPAGVNLLGANVVILGGGGIAEALLRMLDPFRAKVTVVRRHVVDMRGARVVGPDQLHEVLPGADLVVLALALTPETEDIVSGPELALMKPTAWIVNVARGGHINTDALVEALQSGSIGGAGLDVVAPEPLPKGHPLWSMERCILTPHVGNTPDMHRPLLEAFTRDNLRRWAAGDELVGVVDTDLGY